MQDRKHGWYLIYTSCSYCLAGKSSGIAICCRKHKKSATGNSKKTSVLLLPFLTPQFTPTLLCLSLFLFFQLKLLSHWFVIPFHCCLTFHLHDSLILGDQKEEVQQANPQRHLFGKDSILFLWFKDTTWSRLVYNSSRNRMIKKWGERHQVRELMAQPHS